MTGPLALRNVPAMSTTLSSALRGGLLGLLLAGLWASPAEAAKPYVEKAPARGFHLFNRPKKKTAEAQWEHVQKLDRAGKTRAASNQALALRLFWPHSPEAPAAQMLHARLLERRGRPLEAFDAYQHLVDNYAGRFEFNEVLDRQMHLAKTTMERRKGKFLFLRGFAAPERAIPLFEKIVASAPEGPHAAEAYYLTGVANERIYEYDLAVDAYFTSLNRFPDGAFAESAALALAKCHVKMSDDAPNDGRALDAARAACVLFLQRYPESDRRADVQGDLDRIRSRQADMAWALARHYDRIVRNPVAALIEYRTFVALHPDAPQVPAAQRRIEQLATQENP